MARPTKYSVQLAEEICELISDGMSLRKVCELDDKPAKITVLRWLRDKETFRAQYARAKEESADSWADDINAIADDVLKGKYDPQAARVAIDAKKWAASKLKPKKYGDKLDLTSAGEKITPILGGNSVPGDDSHTQTTEAE